MALMYLHTMEVPWYLSIGTVKLKGTVIGFNLDKKVDFTATYIS